MKVRLIVKVIVASLIPAIIVSAGQPVRDVHSVSTAALEIDLAGTTLWRLPKDVEVRGDYAYCAMTLGLVILDISNPAAPTVASQVLMPGGAAQEIELSGDHVFVADAEGGFRVVDVANPTSPQLLETTPIGGNVRGLGLAPGYAYAAALIGGLIVIDTQDPAAPAQVTTLPVGEAWDVIAYGQHLYVASYYDGIWVVDNSDPAHPIRDTLIDTPDRAFRLWIYNDQLWVADLS